MGFDKSTIDLMKNLYELLSDPETQQGIRRIFGKSKKNRVTSPMIFKNLYDDFVRHADSTQVVMKTAIENELSTSSVQEISLEISTLEASREHVNDMGGNDLDDHISSSPSHDEKSNYGSQGQLENQSLVAATSREEDDTNQDLIVIDDYNKKEGSRNQNWDNDIPSHSYETTTLIHERTCEDKSPSVGSPSSSVEGENANRNALVELEEYDRYTDDSRHTSSLLHENDDNLESSLDGTQALSAKDGFGGTNSNHEHFDCSHQTWVDVRDEVVTNVTHDEGNILQWHDIITDLFLDSSCLPPHSHEFAAFTHGMTNEEKSTNAGIHSAGFENEVSNKKIWHGLHQLFSGTRVCGAIPT
ncbi:hypothetical protein SUGI_1203150 [Cryptomeria japonica]|nr:hypothetical protein SUGI_1203150 [Cryptomeria japonica]